MSISPKLRFEENRYEYNEQKQPYEVTLSPGKYFFECVGASGGFSNVAAPNGYDGGWGAKVSGYSYIKKYTTVYIYVGGKGSDSLKDGKSSPGGFNGGGKGGHGLIHGNSFYHSGGGGGGATDIRLKKGDTYECLMSRVMVAGGGGGRMFQQPGSGGELLGESSKYTVMTNPYGASCTLKEIVEGGNQTSEILIFGHGADGIGGTDYDCGREGKGGGGGGWYGGAASQAHGYNSNASGGGGSSYISGYDGCEENIDFIFTKGYMEGGSKTKHRGNGYVIITKITPITQKVFYPYKRVIPFIILIITCSF